MPYHCEQGVVARTPLDAADIISLSLQRQEFLDTGVGSVPQIDGLVERHGDDVVALAPANRQTIN